MPLAKFTAFESFERLMDKSAVIATLILSFALAAGAAFVGA